MLGVASWPHTSRLVPDEQLLSHFIVSSNAVPVQYVMNAVIGNVEEPWPVSNCKVAVPRMAIFGHFQPYP